MFGLVPPAVGSLHLPVQGLKTYSMKTLPRGCCCIINNYDFGNSSLTKREGTQVDEGEPHSLMEDGEMMAS